MIFTIELRPLALMDLQEAYDYYNSIREDLLYKLPIFLDRIEENPFKHSFVNKPIRQGKLKRFPYDVFTK